MIKTIRPEWIFFPFAAIFGLLLFRSPDEALLCGALYAILLGIRLPLSIRPRELFPLVMLFLFLLVLTQTPARQFTSALIYTVRSLILFRTLIISLNEIQASELPTPKSAITWILGLTVGLFASAILLYSTFRPVPLEVLQIDRYFVAAPVLILGTLFTPLWIPGITLGIISFYPTLQLSSLLIFCAMGVAYALWRPRTRTE